MPAKTSHIPCNCGQPINRRDFLKTTAAGLAVASAAPLSVMAADGTLSDQGRSGSAETLVTTLYKSLSEEQKKSIAFPFDHPLRSKVDNNWFITKEKVGGKFYSRDQQAMIREIFVKIHSPEYALKVIHQVEEDSGEAGFGDTSIALFGEPGLGKFEFVLTGRHCTRRCDGNSVEGAAFGGPIFYGHAAGGANERADHPGNVYWFQALRANQAFKMLDGKQREMALLDKGRGEQGTDTVKLTGKKTDLPGIPLTELTRDQKDEVKKVMADVLAPFRKEDADEAIKLIEQNGFDNLHLAFYKGQDIGNDGVWDVLQIEGPAMLWYFRGAPHVHTWLHVRENA
ncbi:MAG: DUF3500 domain-containing protein [Verrucomicrobia bacterium]|nr:DUF3500 domain-containing protein [Verrucomicrobiota bacterium]